LVDASFYLIFRARLHTIESGAALPPDGIGRDVADWICR
jgi:hypothetical protein